MMTEKILKIKIGEEYKAKVENLEDFKDSMFKDVYDKAFDCIGSILAENLNNKNDKENYEKYNNIVSFVGERGTGKTSAMLSVSGALKDEYPTKFKEETFRGLQSNDKPKRIFNEIGVIDPSHFDENSNILEIILAKMFKKFKKRVEDKNNSVDHVDKRKLIKAFEEVFENLKTIQDPKDLYKGEALDALLKMSASTDLKGNMTDLVKKYLKFFNKSDDDSNKKNGVLLLEIDDIDLSTKHAYEMVEQIRKYLIIPNVVILMAVKMEQLSHIVERNMRIEFEIMLEKSHMNDEEPKNMAEKYLEKLIPLDRRLFLPTLEGINLDIDLIIQDKEGKEYIIGKDGNKEIKNIIRYLIFKRTGNMFFNTDTQVSYIIPRTLRELVNLVSKLIAMKNNDKKVEDKTEITLSDLNSDQKNKNYESFKEYFLSYWVESTLKSNHVDVIREVIKRDIKERNKYIVRTLDQEYSGKLNNEIKKINELRKEKELEEEYTKIIDFANKSTNISLGDILLVLDLINRLIVDAEDKKFIFAIKTTYSIMLYGLIREIKGFTKFISEESEKIKEEITKKIEKKLAEKSKDEISNKIEEELAEKIKEELSKEKRIRKNKIDEYKSLLGQSLYNINLYKKLEEFTFEYKAIDIGIDSNKFGTIKEFKSEELTFKEMENKVNKINNEWHSGVKIIEDVLEIKPKTKIEDDKNKEKFDKHSEKTSEIFQNKQDIDLEYFLLSEKFEEDFKKSIKILTTVSGDKQNDKRNYDINFAGFSSEKKIYRFDILGFFYNFLERKELRCYIGNIELLERILNIKKLKENNFSNMFIIFLTQLIENYETIVNNEFPNGKFDISKDEIINELKIFCKKYKDTQILEEELKKIKKYKESNINNIKKMDVTNLIRLIEDYSKGKKDSVKGLQIKKDLDVLVKKQEFEEIKEEINHIKNRIKNKDNYKRLEIREELKKIILNKFDFKDDDIVKALNQKSAKYYSDKGKEKAKLGKWEEAISDYDKAIELDSSDGDYYNGRGVSKVMQNKYKEAEKDFDEAIKLDSSTAIYYNRRGLCKNFQGKYEEAIKDYEEAIKLDPKTPLYYSNRGISKESLKNYKGAILDYDKALELDPNYKKAKNNKENCIQKMNKNG